MTGYRTLAETGRRLGGLTAEQVLELIHNGPLVGRQLDGELMVHDEDLRAFFALRRPRLVWDAATSL